MAKKKYYAVFAADGVFVHWQYERAWFCMGKYFRGQRTVVTCKSREEAIERAREHLCIMTEGTRVIPEKLEVDRFYYIAKLPLKTCLGEGEVLL